MNGSKFNEKFTIVWQDQEYSAKGFLEVNFSKNWLKEIQLTIDFWLGKEQHLVIKTSGSTGAPKDILLSKEVLLHSVKCTLNFFNLKPNSSALLFLPCQFIGGKMLVFRAMIGGLKLHLLEPKSALSNLKTNFDFVSLTPMQATNSIGQLNKFKQVLLGGGPVSESLKADLTSVSSSVYLGYGMTETASHIALKKLNGLAADELFTAMPGVSFSINERNCLVIDAPKWQTNNLVTNDIVELKSSTSFKWLGRTDNVINSGGVKLYPEQIERKLEAQLSIPFFIGAVPDAVLGQKVVLCVESDKSLEVDLSDFSSAEKPRKIYWLPSFNYTPNGKIDRASTLEQRIK